MKTMIMIIGATLALPVVAASSDDFLKEMSRTDGNARGEFFKPEVGRQALLPPSKRDLQFQVEIQRTDGYVAEVAKPEPDRKQTAKADEPKTGGAQ